MLVAKNPLELLTNDPVELSLIAFKAKLMLSLSMHIQKKGFSQAEAAIFFGVTQPRISNLMKGKISKFSIDILLGMWGRMGFLVDTMYDPDSQDNPLSVFIKKSAV